MTFNEGTRDRLILVGCVLASLLPFIAKPVHLDDPGFLRCASQALADPSDPFGATFNWFGITQSLADIMRNPPLACYVLAAIAAVAGWHEVALHAGFLVIAVGALLGTYALARRLTTAPLLASLAMLATPGFLVSSTTLMCDVLMLAFLVWAVACFVGGIDDRRPALLACAALCALGAALSKYNGLVGLPLLALWALLRERRLGGWLLALALPAAGFAAYLWLMNEAYGEDFRRGILVAAGGSGPRPPFSQRVLLALVVSGGSFSTALFFLPFLRRALVHVAPVALGSLLLLAFVALPGSPTLTPTPQLDSPSILLQAGVFAVAGALVLALALRALVIDRDAGAILLTAWVLGTFALATLASWSVSVRYLLPCAPAVAILLARAASDRGERALSSGRAWLPYLPLAPALAVSLVVAVADARLAESARRAAHAIHDLYAEPGRRIWFQGHWGFQYYMETLGAVALDMRAANVSAGDVVIVPGNNANTFGMNQALLRRLEPYEALPPTLLTTMSRPLGAGFYASVWGPLPFVVGEVPAEVYDAFVVSPP